MCYNVTMKKLLYILIVSFSASIAAQPYDATKNLRKTSTITWVVAPDVHKTCVEEFAKVGVKVQYKMDACAIWDGDTCKILTKRRPREDSIGHEVMHCFQEYYH